MGFLILYFIVFFLGMATGALSMGIAQGVEETRNEFKKGEIAAEQMEMGLPNWKVNQILRGVEKEERRRRRT